MNNVFLLSVSVSANVRQSTQIKMEDLKLPRSVIETLEEQQSVSVRPNLSGKLKEFLSELRLMQRQLYDECTIHRGDAHFLHPDNFDDAMQRIKEIRSKATELNEKLCTLWVHEYEKWQSTVSNFIDPLFSDEMDRAIVKEAYLKLFPTQDEFKAPINVFVVGPCPVDLEVAESAEDHSLSGRIAQASAINTAEVLEAAQASAADRALEKAAELLDDLDVRVSSKVGERQLGSSKRRGSWEIAAQQLKLISKHCSGFENTTKLLDELLDVGLTMKGSINPKQRDAAFNRYTDLKAEIRQELESIVERRESSEGLDTLRKSLALSGTYKDLISAINTADNEEQLNELNAKLNTEVAVMAQRTRHLKQLFEKRSELVHAANRSLDDHIEEVRELNVESEEDCDF
jgi:hypothetical protein